MQKWIAIRAGAFVAIAGGVVWLLFSVLLAAGLLVMAPRYSGPVPPAVLRLAAILAGLLFGGLAAWGICAGIGVFRRRAWARVSMALFAAVLVLLGATGAVGLLLAPSPENTGVDDRFAVTVRYALLILYALVTALGVWLLALFSRRSARPYFTKGGAVGKTARPAGIVFIAGSLFAGAVWTALAAVLHGHAVLFGQVAAGWAAVAVYTIYTAVQIYLGAGLLQLDEGARIWSIVFFFFAGADGLSAAFLPGRTDVIGKSLANWLQVDPLTLPGGWFIALISVVCAAVPIWLLARSRPAFGGARCSLPG